MIVECPHCHRDIDVTTIVRQALETNAVRGNMMIVKPMKCIPCGMDFTLEIEVLVCLKTHQIGKE
jgi:hypothetical protein